MIDFKSNNNVIHNFTIVGERHSGTNYVEKLFTGTDCWKSKSDYRAFDIPITWDFGFKHWFGFESKKIYEHGNNTLFICLVRNPWDWIMAMYRVQYHTPETLSKGLLEFVTNEWWSIGKTQEIMEDRNYITKERYKNIFEMRRFKTNYILHTIPLICNNYVIIKYENLLDLNSEKFVNFISSTYGLALTNHPQTNTYKPKNHHLSKDQSEIKEIISSSLDWKLENQCGYYDR